MKNNELPPKLGPLEAPSPMPPPLLPLMDQFPQARKQHFYDTPTFILNNLGAGQRLLGFHDVPTNQSFVSFQGDKKTVAHEAAHSIWEELSKDRDTRWEWERVHAEELQPQNTGGTYLPDVSYYSEPSHSFAEAYSMFATRPQFLFKNFPQVWNFFKRLRHGKIKIGGAQ